MRVEGGVVEPSAIVVGTELPSWRITPTAVQLFRFSAVTWNPHRVHYDQQYARDEGYPDILVQSHLHGCFLTHAVLRWAGKTATLRRFRWQNRHIAMPGDTLTITGTVTAVRDVDAGRVVDVELEERNQDDVLCAPAGAVLVYPSEL